jgi:hypothetical protein
MSAPKRRKRVATLPDNVVRFPGRDYSFEAVDFGEKLSDTYRARANDVDLLQSVLSLTSAELKAKLAALPEADRDEIGEMISHFEDRATNYASLSEFFKSAAARVSAVNAKLV